MCPISGENWNNGTNAGVWTLNLNNDRDNSNDNIGFRSDSLSPRKLQNYGGIKGDAFRRVVSSTAKSTQPRVSGRANYISFEGQAV